MENKCNTMIILFVIFASTVALLLCGILTRTRNIENRIKTTTETTTDFTQDTFQIDSIVSADYSMPLYYPVDTIEYRGVKFARVPTNKRRPKDTLCITYPGQEVNGVGTNVSSTGEQIPEDTMYIIYPSNKKPNIEGR